MKKVTSAIFAAVCALAILAVLPAPAQAQDQSKPPLYTYVANWVIPRAQWAEMDKPTNQGILEKALADGTLVGYGTDVTEVHQIDGPTHDSWWSSHSMAGLLKVLDAFAKSGSSTSPVLSSATKHWDNIVMSRYYNWHSGSFKGAYTRGGTYKLKAEAPNDALETLSKNLFAPLFEKMLADGTILEYEIDTEAIHTENPSTFWIVLIMPTAEGLDKFDSALRESMKKDPLAGTVIDSMVDYTGHKDNLAISAGTYK